MNWSLSLLSIITLAPRILLKRIHVACLQQWRNVWGEESGEQQGDYALLVALVVVAALAALFIVGPQVAIVYAQSAQSGAGIP